MKLSPQDLQKLRKSGLTDTTIEACGFRTVDDSEGRAILGWDPGVRGNAGGLLVPYGASGYAKIRTHEPRPKNLQEGRKQERMNEHAFVVPGLHEIDVRKYEAPVGQAPRLWMPPDALLTAAQMQDASKPLVLTEGELKAALLAQEGWAVVGLPGVWMAGDSEARAESMLAGGDRKVLAPELKALITKGREIWIAFDSDIFTNPSVMRAATRLAEMIEDAGGVAWWVPLRSESKEGVDDFIVRRTRELAANEGIPEDRARVLAVEQWKAEAQLCQPAQQAVAFIAAESPPSNDDIRSAWAWALARLGKGARKWLAGLEKAGVVSVLMVERLTGELTAHEEAAGKIAYEKIRDRVIPVLNGSHRLYREATQEHVYVVNGRNEAAEVAADIHLPKAIQDAAKEAFNNLVLSNAYRTNLQKDWLVETSELASEPEPFCFRGDDRLCFKRFDWEPRAGTYPAWEEFLGRLSDRDAFMAFVWSCFEMKSRSRQFVWLRGDGQDGKSTVVSVLTDLFGNAGHALNDAVVRGGERFVLKPMRGKRFLGYADCKNTKFGMTGMIRNITSGDYVPLEGKGADQVMGRLRVKLMVASNPKPEMTNQRSDQSRFIYIEVGASQNINDPTWESRITRELPAFLWACRELYEKVCGDHGDIPVNQRTKELRGEAAETFEEEWQDIFGRYLVADPAGKVEASELQRIYKLNRLSNMAAKNLKEWMERTHGIRAVKSNGARFYRGMRLREGAGLALVAATP